MTFFYTLLTLLKRLALTKLFSFLSFGDFILIK